MNRSRNRSGSPLVLAVVLLLSGPSVRAEPAMEHGDSSSSDLHPRGVATWDWELQSDQTYAQLGFSVSTAGDVNGDGYSDVIVGIHRWDGTYFDGGRAVVYAGGPDGLAGTELWSAEGFGVLHLFGQSVSTAGDVNGDGYDDILVGAPYGDDGTSELDEGYVYLYYGSPTGPSSTPDWVTESNDPGSLYGARVAYAGDVNADGFDDFLVGAPLGGEPDAGTAYLYLGRAGGPLLTADRILEGDQLYAGFGQAVATAGDVNGDGFDDVLIGQPSYDSGGDDTGRVLCYHGSPDGLSLVAAWESIGSMAGARHGFSVATAGDVNGDGYADVVVGAPHASQSAGEASLYLGSSSTLSLGPDAVATGDLSGHYFGRSVATAGDLNGDGIAELMVGAPGNDRLYAFSAADPPALPYFFWPIEGFNDAQFAYSLAPAGDVNGDGFGDLIVAAHDADIPETNEGWVGVLHGKCFRPSIARNEEQVGYDPGESFGSALAASGDLDGDGRDDIVVGAPRYDGVAADVGRLVVLEEPPDGVTFAPASFHEGTTPGGRLGHAVAYAGDVNGDGYNDVIAGAPGASAAHVYYGSATGLAAAPDWSFTLGFAVAGFGSSVAGAGDVNGDGYADVVIGGPDYSETASEQGIALVFLGSSQGLASSPADTLLGTGMHDHFGYRVAGIGDFNADGYDDLAVSAPDADPGIADAGVVDVFYGNAGGTFGSPAWSVSGFTTGLRLGTAIAGIGDYDADGFSDMIVSDQLGVARVYRGGVDPTNVDDFTIALDVIVESITSCDWDLDGRSDLFFGGDFYGIFDAVQTVLARDVDPGGSSQVETWGEEFGRSLAAGDVNGDGYPDVVSGDPDYILVAPDDGRIEVRYGNTDDSRSLAPSAVAPRARTTALEPIALQGTTPETNAYLLEMRGVSAAGRTDVRLEWQAEPMGTPFPLLPDAGSWVDTGAPDSTGSAVELAEGVTGLPLDARIRWRVRAVSRSPYFPRTPWFTNAPAATAMWHFRTPATMVAVEPGEPAAPGGLSVTQAAPNPFRSRSSFLLVLDRAGDARVDVVDVSGRRVAGLVNGPLAPGEHRISWDGRTGYGARASAGVYYVRLAVGGETSVQRVVLLR